MKYITFIPYIAIILLVVAVMFMRGEKVKANGERDQALSEVESLRDINAQNANTIRQQANNQQANDKIVAELAENVAAIKNRGTSTRTIIKEAIANDPKVKAWADTEVPPAVRDALRRKSGSVQPSAEAGH